MAGFKEETLIAPTRALLVEMGGLAQVNALHVLEESQVAVAAVSAGVPELSVCVSAPTSCSKSDVSMGGSLSTLRTISDSSSSVGCSGCMGFCPVRHETLIGKDLALHGLDC